jgi:hypothetical protein
MMFYNNGFLEYFRNKNKLQLIDYQYVTLITPSVFSTFSIKITPT